MKEIKEQDLVVIYVTDTVINVITKKTLKALEQAQRNGLHITYIRI